MTCIALADGRRGCLGEKAVAMQCSAYYRSEAENLFRNKTYTFTFLGTSSYYLLFFASVGWDHKGVCPSFRSDFVRS